MSKLIDDIRKILVYSGLGKPDIGEITRENDNVVVPLIQLPFTHDGTLYNKKEGAALSYFLTMLFTRADVRYELHRIGELDTAMTAGKAYDLAGVGVQNANLVLKQIDEGKIAKISQTASEGMNEKISVGLKNLMLALGVKGVPEFWDGILVVPDMSIKGQDETGSATALEIVGIINRRAARLTGIRRKDVYSLPISGALANRIINKDERKFGLDIATDAMAPEFIREVVGGVTNQILNAAMKKVISEAFNARVIGVDGLLKTDDELRVFISATSTPGELKRAERLQFAELKKRLEEIDISADLRLNDKVTPGAAPEGAETAPHTVKKSVMDGSGNVHAELKFNVTCEVFHSMCGIMRAELGRER